MSRRSTSRRPAVIAGAMAVLACTFGVAAADAGAATTALGAGSLTTKTTVGPVQPVGEADARALYGRQGAPAGAARAAYGVRGCRVARTAAQYHLLRIRMYTLVLESRFCWDKRRKRAVQRGYKDTRSDISRTAAGRGISMKDERPMRALSRNWRGAKGGMTLMRGRYLFNECAPAGAPPCFEGLVFIAQHGHYDGTVFDRQYRRK